MKRWIAALLPLLLAGPVSAAPLDDLVHAYPDFLAGYDATDLIWRDGTRMKLDAGEPSILDQMRLAYPAGAQPVPPLTDPGRLRNRAFFQKMYGDCRAGEVTPKLARVVWLPQSLGRTISITSINGIDRQLSAISIELDALPAADRKFLSPLGGTYSCRVIADNHQTSMHAWGAAIDINVAYSDYWFWRRGGAYENRIPAEIVAIFERHGFIWGGKWAHYDTMHFEYRPELLGE